MTTNNLVTAPVQPSPSPVPLNLADVRMPSTLGFGHSCAIVDQKAQCWGWNLSGQLGNGSLSDAPTPTAVTNLDDVAELVWGAYHTCALQSAGNILCWGDNAAGQLGDGTRQNSTIPKPALGGNAVQLACAGLYCCARRMTGDTSCWGDNTFGQAGIGFTSQSSPPTSIVSDLSNTKHIATGSTHACAITDEGEVYCWGSNSSGQLGDGSQVDSTTPVKVVGLSFKARHIAAGENYTCSVLVDGSTHCWGNGSFGQLGNGTSSSSMVPQAVSGLSPVERLSARGGHTCAHSRLRYRVLLGVELPGPTRQWHNQPHPNPCGRRRLALAAILPGTPMKKIHHLTATTVAVAATLFAACGDDTADTATTANGGSGAAQQGAGGAGGALFPNTGPGSSSGGDMGGAGGMNTGGEGAVSPEWDEVLSGPGAAFTSDVAIDAAGNVVVVGAFNGTFNFGGADLTSSAGGTQTNMFVTKYSPTGAHLWSNAFGGGGELQSASAVATDAQGNIALCGRFRGNLNFGGTTLTNGDQFPNVFVAKIGADGMGHIFSTDFPNPDGTTDECFDVKFDSAGALWATGWFQNQVDLGGGTLMASGGTGDRDIFLAKFGPDGTHMASGSYGGPEFQVGLGLATAPNGNVAVVGRTDGAVDFGSGNIANDAGQRAFVAQFNGTAGSLGGQIFLGDGEGEAVAAAYDAAGDLFVGGNYKTGITIGSTNLEAAGGADDVFVARFAAGGGLTYGVSLGGTSAEQLNSMAIDSDGYVVLAGRYNGAFSVNGSSMLASAGGFDGFLVKLGPPGNPFWGFGFGDAEAQNATGVAIGNDGSMVMVGDFTGDIDLGSGSVGPGFSQDIFVAKFTD